MYKLAQKWKQILLAKVAIFRNDHPRAFRMIAYYGLVIAVGIIVSVCGAFANI